MIFNIQEIYDFLETHNLESLEFKINDRELSVIDIIIKNSIKGKRYGVNQAAFKYLTTDAIYSKFLRMVDYMKINPRQEDEDE